MYYRAKCSRGGLGVGSRREVETAKYHSFVESLLCNFRDHQRRTPDGFPRVHRVSRFGLASLVNPSIDFQTRPTSRENPVGRIAHFLSNSNSLEVASEMEDTEGSVPTSGI